MVYSDGQGACHIYLLQEREPFSNNSVIPSMTIETLNNLEEHARKEELHKCCGSSTWVEKLHSKFQVLDAEVLLNKSDEVWVDCVEADWLEAFTHHPKIGDADALKKKFASTAAWASGEQSG